MKAFPLGVLAGALLGSTALFCGSVLTAQDFTAAPRITAKVDGSSLTTLSGNVPRLAQTQYDQGEASTRLTGVRLVLSRSSEQQAALDTYLAELQDKSSPNYHKWLTAAEFGKLYGPADSDVAALATWLESHGLTVETVSTGRTNIAFSGTVSQVEEAFHTSIHSFQAGEQQFISNTTDPQIPSALATVVKGVAHLNTIQPKPLSVRGSAGKFNPQTNRLEPAEVIPANGARPGLTTGSGTSTDPYTLYMVPGDAATVYDTPNTAFNANYTSGTNYTGAAVYIGIGGDAAIDASIVEEYRMMFIGDSSQPMLNYCTSTSASSCTNSPGSGYVAADADEAYLDLEISGGLAPGATIVYYASSDLYTAIEAAIDQNAVDIFSLSFGECEQDLSTSDNAQINSWWEQAAGQGIAVTVSAGDSGSAGCDVTSAKSGKNVPDAVDGLQVSGFASTPYNIAVGGTDFYALEAGFSTYVSTSQGSSSTYYRTALGYIPESVWNDSTQSDNLPISENVPWTGSNANIIAGSGGASSCSTNTTVDTSPTAGSCISGYSKPPWQTGAGVPVDGARDLPDVSLMSGNGADNATWLVCTNDTAKVSGTNTSVTTNCATVNGSFYFSGFGGTSTAAPAFAGILALVQQSVQPKTGCTWVNCSRLGQAAKELYALYNGSHSDTIFHDVTVGNNSVPCTSGTPNCAVNALGNYYESGYNTKAGYDMATGLGSVDVNQLLTYWGSASTGLAAATVKVSPGSASITANQSLNVTVTVASSPTGGITPTGTVTLTSGNYSSLPEPLNSSGSYQFTIPGDSLSAGNNVILTASYSGDPTYAEETGSATVTMTQLTPSILVSSASTLNSNYPLTVTVTLSATGGGGTPTGIVQLTGPYIYTQVLNSSGVALFIIPANSYQTSGNNTLSAYYEGDTTYDTVSGSTTVAVTHLPVLIPTVTVTPALNTVDKSQSLNVTTAVTGSGATPTGTVTLTSGSYNSGAQALVTTGCTAGSCVTITIPANSLTDGTDMLTANYSGDPNYYASTGFAVVTVAPPVFALAAATPAAISPGGTATSTITVNSTTGYAGIVTLTCALTTSPSGATDLPACSVTSGSPVTLSSTTTSGTATITVYTAAATSALAYPRLPGKGRGWEGAGGGAVLAFLLFLGIPARRRGWRSMLGILVVMASLGSLSACGGGSSTSTTTGTLGTTPDTYTFIVTATGTPSVAPAPTVTFSVVVN
jgi:hypothetical protein